MLTTTTTTPLAPSGRYIVSNNGLPLYGGTPGGPMSTSTLKSAPATPPAWYLETAPADTTIQLPGKHCYVLRAEQGSFFVKLGRLYRQSTRDATASEEQPHIDLLQYNATTTPDQKSAWVFVLDGEYNSSNGMFEGKIVSPDGRYQLGLHAVGGPLSPIEEAFMSPLPNVNAAATWKLQLAPLTRRSGNRRGSGWSLICCALF